MQIRIMPMKSYFALSICLFAFMTPAWGQRLNYSTDVGAVLDGNVVYHGDVVSDPQTGTLRWTFDSLYLWDGLPVVPLALGLFAIPEIADMAITRQSISGNADAGSRWAQLQGVKDVFQNKWLLLRCATIGSGQMLSA